MAQKLVEFHEQALMFMDDKVAGIQDVAWQNQSPCEEWSVRDVVNHITAENLWAEPLMDGQTVEQVGDRFDGDVLGSDPKSAWQQASKVAHAAFGAPGATEQTVHVSFGDISGRHYLEQMTCDLIIHGWDIAKGSGQDDAIPGALVDIAMKLLKPMVESGQTGSVFAKPVQVDDDADAQTRVLALTGRKR